MARTIEELKEKYKELGLDPDCDLSKKELREAVEAAEEATNILDKVEVKKGSLVPVEESRWDNPIETTDKAVDNRPAMHSPKWTEYVMTLFEANELDNGMPKADALRRVADLLLDPYSSDTEVVQVPTIDNAGRATVVVRLQFSTGIRVCGSADVYSGNTEKTYAMHPVATAETRAEARALRKALRLTKILSAEELQNADPDEATGIDKSITGSMINNLKVMSTRVGVDPFKVGLKLKYDIQSIEDLKHQEGLAIANYLGKIQRKEIEVTDDIKG